MATKAAEAQAHPAAAPVERPVRAAGGRGKLIMIAVVALLLLGAAGGAAWYFMHSSEDEDVPVAKGKKAKDKDAKDGKDGKETAVREGPRKPAEFMNLDTFIVNLQDESGTHYLQTAIVFEVTDEKSVLALKAQMPVIRSKLLLLLSSKLPSELKTPEGKEKLAEEIVTEARKYLNVKSPEEALPQVHFGSFVIQ
jgi:flagellar FliL protein